MERRDDLKTIVKLEKLTAMKRVSNHILDLHGSDPKFMDTIKTALKNELTIAFNDFRENDVRFSHLNLLLGDFIYKKIDPMKDPERYVDPMTPDDLIFTLSAVVYTDTTPREEDEF